MDKAYDRKFETEEENTVSMTHLPSPECQEEHRNTKKKPQILKKLKMEMKSRKFLTDGEASDSEFIREIHTESDDQSRRTSRRVSIDQLFSYMKVVKYPSRSSEMENPFKKDWEGLERNEEFEKRIKINIERFKESESFEER